ncbi:MAG: hypothetical protein QG622_3090 [Actinomycetota bacterium]|nr:hypothetical protein [Actinomycetota bacterium]
MTTIRPADTVTPGPAGTVPTTIRLAGAGDRSVVVDALVHAVNWSPARRPLTRAEVLGTHAFAHYVDGWPTGRDLGVVAELPGGVGVGAAWLRFLPLDDPGYGFAGAGIPELSVGVAPGHRGRGVGRRMVRTLLASATGAGIGGVSLSVERANPARALYLSEGFTVIGGDGNADTMLYVADTA